MKQRIVVYLLIAFLLAVTGTAARAQESTPMPCMDCRIPIPPIWNMEGLEIPYQRVSVTIDNQVATTRVEQLFRNPNDWMLEGTYFFPLPPGAAVSELTMWVDGTPIEARILAKDEARAIYDAIVRRMRDPALLEYVGADAIQANVFPIPPGDERKIEIEYSYLLTAENGAFHFIYPQSAGLYTQTSLDEQSIRVEVNSDEAIRTLYSPSHRVAIERPTDFSAIVGYEDANVTPTDDFELYYTVSPEEIGLTLLSYKDPGEDGFFLLLVAPGIEPGEVVAKDVIVILDTSGSMEGEKMVQAKEAAAWVIDHLNPEDRFALVSFSTSVSLYEPELLPANQPGNYRQHIESLQAVGGTNISGALLEAANLAAGAGDDHRPTTIIFLTDGLATEGITDTPMLLQAVDQAMPDNARVFAFGVGDDVDTILLDTLAAEQRGATTYVRPGQAVDEAVSAFYAKVGSPVLTDIVLDTGDIRIDQVYPVELPDLFAGTQLVIAGRYREGGPATVTLTGTANGREQTFTYEDQLFRDEGGEPFIPRLWATRAIGHLMQQIRLQGENPELVQSIVNLSTRYGVITPYTSFLIEEDDIIAQTGAPDLQAEAEQALSAPAEVSGAAAVDRAAVEGSLSAAEAPMPMATVVVSGDRGQTVAQALVQSAGRRTFFLRSGVWVDSAYDGESVPQVIPFASDAYFNLLDNRPDLGEALALGEEIIVVIDGDAYRVSAQGDYTARPDTPQSEPQITEQATPPASSATRPPVEAFGIQLCASAFILPLVVVAGWKASGRRKKSS
ncbi:MAG TPA: VIT domain-containing protein [Promineifilum sp.]|nr:VIT domain-containing protein [Promineifilum sp.]HRO90402.1 VIT domain-containing protein [Promineifilum sp.]HRQ14735.1 VIT domain-containing protein [Promineifilum sp.]